RLQPNEQGLSIGLIIGFYRESFPEQGKRISIHSGGGESVWIVVLANSKLTGFTAVSYFFTLTRDEPKKRADNECRPLRNWWSYAGSNRRPLACHASALPAEL